MKKLLILFCFFQITYPCGVDILALLLRQIGITKEDNLEQLNKFTRTEEELEKKIQGEISAIVSDCCNGTINMNVVWDRIMALNNTHGSSFSEEKRERIFSMLKVEEQIKEQIKEQMQ